MSRRAEPGLPTGWPRSPGWCACRRSASRPTASVSGSIASTTCAPRSPAGWPRRSTCSASILPPLASTRSTPGISRRPAMLSPNRPVGSRPAGAARRGSPWTGLGTVIAKETADHLSSSRVVVIEAILFAGALLVVFYSATTIRENIGQSPFLYLRLLTLASDVIPVSFTFIVGLVIPIIAIALGFDAINSEFNQRTLSRILAQPIYRDALLLGKFLARLLALTIALVSVWLFV